MYTVHSSEFGILLLSLTEDDHNTNRCRRRQARTSLLFVCYIEIEMPTEKDFNSPVDIWTTNLTKLKLFFIFHFYFIKIYLGFLYLDNWKRWMCYNDFHVVASVETDNISVPTIGKIEGKTIWKAMHCLEIVNELQFLCGQNGLYDLSSPSCDVHWFNNK